MIKTIADVEARFGVTHEEHLDRDAEIPVVTALACQGDVSVRRVEGLAQVGTPIPPEGTVVLSGSHAHILFAIPGAYGIGSYAATGPLTGNLLALGVLTVPDGCDVLLDHLEHGDLLIAPGTYVLGRQREFAGEWRQVAD